MRTIAALIAFLAASAALTGCAAVAPRRASSPDSEPDRSAKSPAPVPHDAKQVQPLGKGAPAPTAVLRRAPTVLVFYRGGWCPYCNAHLSQIAEAEPNLKDMGYQVLAVSPDRPGELSKTLDEQDLGYQLLSDSDMDLARAFGLAFLVADTTIEKYRGYGIDLAAASGRDHRLLPVPAVYIVDTRGIIRFAHWDADYKKRLAPKELLRAARDVRTDR